MAQTTHQMFPPKDRPNGQTSDNSVTSSMLCNGEFHNKSSSRWCMTSLVFQTSKTRIFWSSLGNDKNKYKYLEKLFI
jgi:hypothetical protein